MPAETKPAHGLLPVWVDIAVIGLMCLLSLWAWPQIEGRSLIPVHWGISGEIDGYAPKWLGLSILPLLMTFVMGFVRWKMRSEKYAENLRYSRALAGTSVYGALALILCVHALIIFTALGQQLPVPQIAAAGVGLLVAATGALLAAGKTRRNTTVGIRTPWTLADDNEWDKTNRLGGWILLAMGGSTAVGGLFLNMYVVAGSILGGVVVLLLVTYVLPLISGKHPGT